MILAPKRLALVSWLALVAGQSFAEAPAQAINCGGHGLHTQSVIRQSLEGTVISVDLIGYDREQVKLSLQDGVLIIRAYCRSIENTQNGQATHARRFKKRFHVDKRLTVDSIKAVWTNGNTLNITVPILNRLLPQAVVES